MPGHHRGQKAKRPSLRWPPLGAPRARGTSLTALSVSKGSTNSPHEPIDKAVLAAAAIASLLLSGAGIATILFITRMVAIPAQLSSVAGCRMGRHGAREGRLPESRPKGRIHDGSADRGARRVWRVAPVHSTPMKATETFTSDSKIAVQVKNGVMGKVGNGKDSIDIGMKPSPRASDPKPGPRRLGPRPSGPEAPRRSYMRARGASALVYARAEAPLRAPGGGCGQAR